MALNGTSRKTPAPLKPAKAEGTIPLDNLFDDVDDSATLKLKPHVKANLPAVKNPGKWDSDVTNSVTLKDSTTARASPHMNKIPPNVAKAFPNRKPMADQPKTLKCNHCKRPVLEHAMLKHIERCLNKKQEKQRKKKEAKDARDAAARKEKSQGDSDEEEDADAGKTASKTSGLLGASKKRKAADEGEDGAPTKKKKKKDDGKAKAPRPKAPVDVEKQCGVELPQGGQCARSLTCKSHSMGAKRAVPGRSAPYDKLLMEYQRKNQAKLQKAAFDANAPNPEDDSLPTGPVDSEEEKDAVMAGMQRAWGGAPLYQPTSVPLRRKYEVTRMKGMLHSALGGRGGNLFGPVGGGGGNFGAPPVRESTVDPEGIVHPRRGSTVPGPRSMTAPSMPMAGRNASLVGA